jgi:hypothetical protein
MIRYADYRATCLTGILIFPLLVLLSGCSDGVYEKPPKMETEYRYWDIDYIESVKIMTVPEGAKIYIVGATADYWGESPVVAKIESHFKVSQAGTYMSQYRMKPNWLWETAKLTNTSWNGPLCLSNGSSGQVTIRAFKDGYKNTEYVFQGDNAQSQSEKRRAIAVMTVSPAGELPKGATGENSILITLEPVGQSVAQPSVQSQQQQPESDSTLALAKQEYELAMKAYEDARREYDQTAAGTVLSEEGYRTMSPAAGLLAGLAGGTARNDAKIKLDSARDRLERAKARLDALNYRY